MQEIKIPVAIITGAASGIANNLATKLIEMGWSLVLADINIEALRENFKDTASDKIITAELDVTEPENWKRVVATALENFTGIDYLFNIAGVTFPKNIIDSEPDLIDRHMDINAKGSMYGTMLVAKEMAKQQSGHIINLASLAGLAPVAGLSFYTASKFAIRGFSLAAAAELKEKGIAVSVIYPDLVKTPMYDYQLGLPPETTAMVFSGSKKVLTPEDVTKAILKVVKTKALELAIPKSRGILSKVGGTFPGILMFLSKSLSAKGKKNIEVLKKS